MVAWVNPSKIIIIARQKNDTSGEWILLALNACWGGVLCQWHIMLIKRRRCNEINARLIFNFKGMVCSIGANGRLERLFSSKVPRFIMWPFDPANSPMSVHSNAVGRIIHGLVLFRKGIPWGRGKWGGCYNSAHEVLTRFHAEQLSACAVYVTAYMPV